jgi:hypothetical protein
VNVWDMAFAASVRFLTFGVVTSNNLHRRKGQLKPLTPIRGVTASLLFLRLAFLREVAASTEQLVGLSKPANRKVIDAEGFDNSFLVAFTEDFGVDPPDRCSTTDGALDDVHS